MRRKPPPVARAEARGRRQLKSQERRRRVLAAANRCFGRHGFRRTSVEMIAADAAVSKGLVFAFFRSKDALYDAVIEQTLLAWTGFAEHEAARFRNQPDLELASMFRGSFEFAEHSPMLSVLMAHRDREIQERLSSLPRIIRNWRNRLAEVIERGISQGVFRREIDPERTSLVIHDIQHLYLDRQVAGAQGDYDADQMETALELLMAGLRVPALPKVRSPRAPARRSGAAAS